MDLVKALRETAQIARERDQLTALPEGMERAADRIADLQRALWVALNGVEVGIDDATPQAIEIVEMDDGRRLVRRSRKSQ
jgi:hypothetical protein